MLQRFRTSSLYIALLYTASLIPGEKITMESFYKNMPVLVTGGCGFIGSHIVEKLVAFGARVTIIDDLSTGNLANIESVKDKIVLINKSIVDKANCLEAVKGNKIIFHLAAFISVPESIKNPAACHDINVNGTLNLLEAARELKAERLVFSSSAAVYGLVNGVCSENMACNPESPYGFSKHIGELYCHQYAKNYGLNTVICRYFNVYGNRQSPHGAYAAVVAKFKNAMANNAPITIFGDGLQTRDFVAVDRVADANLMLAMQAHLIPGEVFNIGTGKSITLLELIENLKKDYPSYSAPIVLEKARPGDIQFSAADCSRYQTIFAQANS